jgi:hypothetical protein
MSGNVRLARRNFSDSDFSPPSREGREEGKYNEVASTELRVASYSFTRNS